MMPRSAFFGAALAAGVFLLLEAGAAFSQTTNADNASAAQQQSLQSTKQPTQEPWQQPAQSRPKVFFPMAEQPEMEMHHHGQIATVMPQFPHLGESQSALPGLSYQLEELERMAAANNPTLRQAQHEIEAEARQRALGFSQVR